MWNDCPWQLKIPIAFFPSKDEPADEVKKSVEIIKKGSVASKSVYKTYDTVSCPTAPYDFSLTQAFRCSMASQVLEPL